MSLVESGTRALGSHGVRLATEHFGSEGRAAILLVMGATASMLGWPERLIEELAERGFFVVRYDHRDTGLSTTYPAGAPDYVVEDMVDDLAAVLDGYALGRAHIVGMSLGGLICQAFALMQPDRVQSLTLIASEPLGWDGDPLPHIAPEFLEHFAELSDLDWSDKVSVREFLLEIERLCAGSGHPFDVEGAKSRVHAVLARSPHLASAFNHGMVQLRDDWSGRFRDIAHPTLIIHGEDDPILPPENGKALASGIRGARLLLLPGVGHELPSQVLVQIADAIAELVRARSSTGSFAS